MNAVDILLDFTEFQLPKLHQILTIGTLHIMNHNSQEKAYSVFYS